MIYLGVTGTEKLGNQVMRRSETGCGLVCPELRDRAESRHLSVWLATFQV